jgi:hypothetical protein
MMIYSHDSHASKYSVNSLILKIQKIEYSILIVLAAILLMYALFKDHLESSLVEDKSIFVIVPPRIACIALALVYRPLTPSSSQ